MTMSKNGNNIDLHDTLQNVQWSNCCTCIYTANDKDEPIMCNKENNEIMLTDAIKYHECQDEAELSNFIGWRYIMLLLKPRKILNTNFWSETFYEVFIGFVTYSLCNN